MFNFFLKMGSNIKYQVEHHRPGLYLYLLFPIAFSFLATFIVTRLLNTAFPDFNIPWSSNFHVHHFVYGFFVLVASGYLALIHNGPRAKYLVSLLYGFGFGLAMDEYALWLKLTDTHLDRWSYDGLLVFIGIVVLIVSAKPGVKLIKNIWPFD